MEPLTSLFQPAANNKTVEELHSHIMALYNTYEKSYSQRHIMMTCVISQDLKVHQKHDKYIVLVESQHQLQSRHLMLIRWVLQYGEKFDFPATKYGKAMEADAKNALLIMPECTMMVLHSNIQVSMC